LEWKRIEKLKKAVSDITKKLIVKLRDEDCIFVAYSETTTNIFKFFKRQLSRSVKLSVLFNELKIEH